MPALGWRLTGGETKVEDQSAPGIGGAGRSGWNTGMDETAFGRPIRHRAGRAVLPHSAMSSWPQWVGERSFLACPILGGAPPGYETDSISVVL
jgi:hypothetical protein